MRVSVLRSSGVVGIAAAGMLAAGAVPASAATAGPGEGSAYGASAQVNLLPGVLGSPLSVKTGELAPSNTAGPTSASVVDAPLKGIVTAKAIESSAEHSSTTGGVTAQASIVDATLPVLAPATGGKIPQASVIKAQCQSTSDGVTGSSEIAGLDLGSLGKVPVSAPPNTTLGAKGIVQVIVNEQVRGSDGSLTVNALHIKLLGGQLTDALGNGDIVLSSATCGKATAVTQPTSPKPPASSQPAPPASPGGGQVSVVPAGAPQTGDGTLADEREGQA